MTLKIGMAGEAMAKSQGANLGRINLNQKPRLMNGSKAQLREARSRYTTPQS